MNTDITFCSGEKIMGEIVEVCNLRDTCIRNELPAVREWSENNHFLFMEAAFTDVKCENYLPIKY